MKIAIILAASFVLFIILDLLWFSVAGNFFKTEIGNIARLSADGSWNVLYLPALMVYLLMSIGLLWFVLPNVNSWGEAALYGAGFGLITYGIYDLTNLATITDWTVKFAIVDMLWGTFLLSLITTLVYKFLY